MSRQGPGPGVPPIPVPQPNVPSALSGAALNTQPAAAPTAGAIGRALGPGTSDQEKVFTKMNLHFNERDINFYYYNFFFIGGSYHASTSIV